MSKDYANVDGLLKYHVERNKETINKVNKAISDFKKGKKKITVKAVAKKANVSVATIYNNPALKERIDQLKDIQRGGKDIDAGSTIKSIKKVKMDEMRDTINRLRTNLEAERQKNGLLLGELEKKTSENIELKARVAQYRNYIESAKKQ
ncbi:DUF6262 family protein [Ruminiclostridium cellulolyticum]|uniref:Transposase n=1 Tax=Ruminiclostridium cellulolyticum (strain ATCC 35319 / DSM 5812 / JCM 6584 / H10) TaxID=394503 RepID=B8I4A4_RUMCH|nr:DUF6262 family protein [Ruminiclostridium cellulolyticum]ACL74458.1 hypothetical protein Ccel_0070 [Ruminiclostridium cellulolyticum H10]